MRISKRRRTLHYRGIDYDLFLRFLRAMIIAGIGSKRLFGLSPSQLCNCINLEFIAGSYVYSEKNIHICLVVFFSYYKAEQLRE